MNINVWIWLLWPVSIWRCFRIRLGIPTVWKNLFPLVYLYNGILQLESRCLYCNPGPSLWSKMNAARCSCPISTDALTHWSRVTHICVSKLTIIGSDNGLSPAGAKPLFQWWNIVNSNLLNTFQWNRKRNSYIFIQENTFENVVLEMAAILSRPQCVKPLDPFLK